MTERSAYRHPRHDAIVELIELGLRGNAIAAELGVDRRAVTRVRDILGLPTYKTATSMQQKVERFSTPLDGGHTGWTGRRKTNGLPAIRHRDAEIPASHVAFSGRTGRKPVGIVKAECGMSDCLTPGHLSDETERLTVRMQERALWGLDPVPWDVCPKGLHTWDEAGRLQPDLTPYCRACNSERAARIRAADKAERSAT